MKRIPLFLILLAVVISGCGGKNIVDPVPRIVDVFIEQGGNRIEIKNDTAELRRIPFSIIINFSRPDSLFVSASFSSDTFNNAGSGLPLNELAGFRNPGIDEEPFNRDNILSISSNSPNLWYYTDDTDHRFNLVKKYEHGIICQRDVFSVSDTDTDGQPTPLQKLKKDSIYLVFVTVDWNEDYTRMIEQSRKLIRIKFVI